MRVAQAQGFLITAGQCGAVGCGRVVSLDKADVAWHHQIQDYIFRVPEEQRIPGGV